MEKRFVSYLRVSTARQGQSGLGIEAQRSIVRSFLKGEQTIIEEFIEVESGTKGDRPVLASAIELCKRENATLIIAKLDRLYRNVLFTARLMDSGVEFIACDVPFANRLTLHILSAIAEWEATRISERTRGALQELKKRGKQLGTPSNLTMEARRKGVTKRQSILAGDNARRQVKQVIKLMLADDSITITEITRALNEAGYRTTNGSPVYREYVSRLIRELQHSNANLNDQTRSVQATS